MQGFLQSLAEGLVSVAGGLDSVASGFKSAFDGLLSSGSASLSGGDILWMYVSCQIAAALISALSAFAYVRYFLKK